MSIKKVVPYFCVLREYYVIIWLIVRIYVFIKDWKLIYSELFILKRKSMENWGSSWHKLYSMHLPVKHTWFFCLALVQDMKISHLLKIGTGLSQKWEMLFHKQIIWNLYTRSGTIKGRRPGLILAFSTFFILELCPLIFRIIPVHFSWSIREHFWLYILSDNIYYLYMYWFDRLILFTLKHNILCMF